MSSVLSQGNGPPGPGVHEIDNFGQRGHKMSLTQGKHPSVVQQDQMLEGQHHTVTEHKILATGGADPVLLLSPGPSLLLSSPFYAAPLTKGCSQRHLQAGLFS